jgi:diguanylate cyclase (GGDEF)-like protein
MQEIARLQIRTAIYSNPLTLLPGSVPLDEHMQRLLDAGAPFAVAYCDLDNFKAYNDVYGYRRGDEVIRFCAEVLTKACIPGRDFLGHIGGDDFIIVFQNPEWEHVCRRGARNI